MKKFVSALSLGLLVLAGEAALAKPAKRAAKPAATAAARAPAKPLDQTVVLSADGTPVMGRAAAPVNVVEFISYTCPHCADFNAESHAELREGMVREGKVRLELRPFLRNEFDLITTMMVLCGPKEKWFGNNDAVLAAQKTWFKEPSDPTYKQRWASLEGDKPSLRKVAAHDLGLYALFEARGYTAAQLDTCLADETRALKIDSWTATAMKVDGVNGTPMFKINGKLQSVYGWQPLKPLIEAALPAAPKR